MIELSEDEKKIIALIRTPDFGEVFVKKENGFITDYWMRETFKSLEKVDKVSLTSLTKKGEQEYNVGTN